MKTILLLSAACGFLFSCQSTPGSARPPVLQTLVGKHVRLKSGGWIIARPATDPRGSAPYWFSFDGSILAEYSSNRVAHVSKKTVMTILGFHDVPLPGGGTIAHVNLDVPAKGRRFVASLELYSGAYAVKFKPDISELPEVEQLEKELLQPDNQVWRGID